MKAQSLFRSLSLIIAGLLGSAKPIYAQVLGGDQVQSAISNAGSYLQVIALSILTITLIIGGIRLSVSSNKEGYLMVMYSIIGIIITALAPQIVTIVRSWTGIGFATGF